MGIVYLRGQGLQYRRECPTTKSDCRTNRLQRRWHDISACRHKESERPDWADPAPGNGTYTIDSGCKGSLTFTGGPSFDIFVAPNGDKLWMIQSNSDTVFQGSATRVSHRTGIYEGTN
jgi:hypothetical protein